MTLIDRRCYGCGTRHRGVDHACSNPIRLRRTMLEETLLADIRKELLAPDVVRWVEREITKAMHAPDDSDKYWAELAVVDAKMGHVVDAIAKIGFSGALQAKLAELERRKAQVQVNLSANQRAVLFPDRAEIQATWTRFNEQPGELQDKATQVEKEGMRNAIKDLPGQIREARDRKAKRICAYKVW